MDIQIPQAASSVTGAGSSCCRRPTIQKRPPILVGWGDVGSNSDEGLKEIYSLISGSAGRPTWNEIYPKLLAHLQSTSVQDRVPAATPKDAVKKDDSAFGFGRAQATPEPKERLGGVVRRSLWL